MPSDNSVMPSGSSVMPSVGSAGEAQPRVETWTWLAHWRSHWDWNDFLYNLLLDLAPATWDTITDLLFAKFLETVDVTSAALSYLSICLPALWLLAVRVSKQKTVIKVAAFLMCFSVGLWARVLLKGYLLLFRAPAILFSGVFLGVKVLAVFVHTPEMAQFSQDMSLAENATEGRLQILLVLHTWIRGGLFHWDTLVSTLLDIGKVGAENFLTSGPKNLLKGKSFFERLVLVLKYLPVFSLTAVFRQCSGIVKVMNYSAGFFLPFNTAFVVSITWIYFIIEHSIFQLWFAVLRFHLLPSIQQLSVWEMADVLLSECNTISMWGGLGRRGSRLPQMIMNTWFLLHNLICISLVLASTSTQDEEIGPIGKVDLFPEMFSSFCVALMVTGGLSYCLAVYQIFSGLEEDQEEDGSDAGVEEDWQGLKTMEEGTHEDSEAGASGSGEVWTTQRSNFLNESGKKMVGKRQHLGPGLETERVMIPGLVWENMEDEKREDTNRLTNRKWKVKYLDLIDKGSSGSWENVKGKEMPLEVLGSTSRDVSSKPKPIGSTWQKTRDGWVRI